MLLNTRWKLCSWKLLKLVEEPRKCGTAHIFVVFVLTSSVHRLQCRHSFRLRSWGWGRYSFFCEKNEGDSSDLVWLTTVYFFIEFSMNFTLSYLILSIFILHTSISCSYLSSTECPPPASLKLAEPCLALSIRPSLLCFSFIQLTLYGMLIHY